MATQKKIDTVTLLTDKVSRAKSIVLADYRGLKHKQLEELRKLLKKSEAEFVVAKNRLFKRALRSAQGKPVESLDDVLQNTTAVLFSYADEIAPLKELLKYFKAAGAGKPKIGLMGATVVSEADVTRLSQLPTRQVLLAQLVGQLNAPIQGLHHALHWNLQKFVWVLKEVSVKNGKTN